MFVITLGVVALWLTRDGLNADGIAYLDASDEYLSGRWPRSGSGYWSPLYPTLLAVARWVGGKSPDRALALAQTVNLGLFLLAFAAFEWLLQSLRAARPTTTDVPPNDIPWFVLAYAMFALTTIGWIRVWLLTPDMGVVAIVFATAAIGLRLTSGRGGWGAAVLLGVLLGAGYLMKAALLPFGVVFLLTLAALTRHRAGLTRAAVAAVVFIAVALPQIVYASKLKGSPTFSDVGRLSYLWFIADVPGPLSAAFPLPAHLPGPSAHQTLAKLGNDVARPALYAIDAPIPGTLPIWYDAGYWYRNVEAPFTITGTARALVRHTRVYLETLGLVLAGGLAAALAAPLSRRTIAAMRPSVLLVIPALGALGMYALVLVQSRYVAPFAVLFVLGLVPPFAIDEVSRRLRIGLATGAVIAAIGIVHQIRVDAPVWRGSAAARTNVVSALAARGIGTGTRVGFIGDAYDALWAHQAGVRFAVLLPRPEAGRFWALDTASRSRVLEQMRARGANVLLAEQPAPGVQTDGWDPLPAGGPPGPSLMVHSDPRSPPITLR